MKLKSFAASAALAFAASVSAGNPSDYVVNIHLADATTITCDFSDEPVVTFADHKMTLECKTAGTRTWEIDEVDSWTFSKGADAIHTVAAQDGGVRLTLADGAVVATGAQGTQLRLVSVDGRQIATATTGADGTCSLSTERLTAGTYIFAAGGKSVKLVVK